ncbi:MAG: SDR family NAD(P)-dependent oxidoreductase [Stellaceae bacterium]
MPPADRRHDAYKCIFNTCQSRYLMDRNEIVRLTRFIFTSTMRDRRHDGVAKQRVSEVREPSMAEPVCVVSGVGPGTGTALARRFTAGGYRVAMLARSVQRLAELEAKIPSTKAFPCDVSDPVQVDAAIAAVERQLGMPEILIHNAVGGAFGSFLEIDPAVLNRNFQVNAMGLLYLARRLAPAMVNAGKGSIIATGNTSALRGKPRFAGFAPTKAAQRILAEAMARDLGPKGVHVAYIVIDAVIDVPWTRERYKERPDEFFIKPAAIADEAWHLAHQDRSAWSFNVEIRPYGEAW